MFLAEGDNAEGRHPQQGRDVGLVLLTPRAAGFPVLAQTQLEIPGCDWSIVRMKASDWSMR